MSVRDVLVAMLAAGLAAGLLIVLGHTGYDPALPGILFSAFVVLIAWRFGPRAGALCGLLFGAAHVKVLLDQGQFLGLGTILSAGALIALGAIGGTAFAAASRRLLDLEGDNVELRREQYRMRKEAKNSASLRTTKSQSPPVASDVGPVTGGTPAELYEAVRSIASSLNERRIVDSTLQTVQEVLGAERVTIHYHDRKADRFLPGVSWPAVADEIPPGDNESLLRACLRRRDLLVRGAGDAAAETVFATAAADVDLAAPVFDRAMLAAVLLVSRPRQGPERAQAPLALLATASGLALASARLVTKSEEDGKRDRLTGLAGVSAIREILSDKLAKGPVAVLLLAADRIREVNEAYGRKAGDKVVAAMSRVVQLELGTDGLVGRYGGATLLVVLAGHRVEGAVAVAERLQRRIPTSVTAGPEGLAAPLSISVGVAAASLGPPDVLLQKVEQALAAALGAGGSGLEVASVPGGVRGHA